MKSAQSQFDFDRAAAEKRAAAPEVLEKIKKLLRLGQSSNLHEAKLALQRAFDLANKHDVEIESLDLDEETSRLVHEYIQTGWRVSFLQKLVLNIVVNFFNVEVCLCAPRVLFVGLAHDVVIARYVFDFLVWAIKKETAAFAIDEKKARRVVNGAKRHNFIQGFIYGVASKLNEAKTHALEDQKWALVLSERKKAREDYLGELVPNTRTRQIKGPRENKTALMRGWERGRETNINRPLEGAQRGTLALA